MLRDIFIDNNVAKNFANPLDVEYKKLVFWLIEYNKLNPIRNAYLVTSNKLLKEYLASSGLSSSSTNIVMIIHKMTREGRLVKFSNQDIKNFKAKHLTKRVMKRLTCNAKDINHIPLVLLSNRKYALTIDDKFAKALTSIPGFVATVASRPEHLPYRNLIAK